MAENRTLQLFLTLKDNLSKGLNKASSSLSSLDKTVIKAASSFFAFNTVSNFINSATKEAIAFDNAMRRVNTITKLATDGFKDMEKEVLKLSKTVPFTAEELASGLFDVASAGIEAENQMAFLTQASIFATAGTTDLNTAITGLTAITKGWGLETSEATRVSDLFFKTNELGQTTVAAVAQSIQSVTAQAKLSGLQLEELFAVYSTFTGVTGNASDVTTQLSGALNALAAPTVRARNEFDRLGIEVGKTAIENKGFAQVAKDVFDGVNGDVEALRKLIPEINGARLIAAVATTQFDVFNEKLLSLKNSTNATTTAFIEMEKSSAVKLKKMSNNFSVFKISIGNAFSGILLFVSEFAVQMANTLNFAITFVKNTFKNFFNFISIGFLKLLDILGVSTDGMRNKIDELFSSIDNNNKEISESFSLAGSSVGKLTANFVDTKQKTEELSNEIGGLTKDLSGVSDNGAAEKVVDNVKTLKTEYQSLKDKGIDALHNLNEEHIKSAESIRNSINNTKQAIDELNASFNKGKSDDTKSVAGQVIATEERIAAIKKELAGNVSNERRKELTEELIQEQLALTQNAEFIKSIDAEVVEARRVAGLTDLQRAIEDFNTKRKLAEQEFNTKMNNLQTELKMFKAKEIQELEIFKTKQLLIQKALDESSKNFEDMTKRNFQITKEAIDAEIELYKQLAKAIALVRGGSTSEIQAINTQGIQSPSSVNITVNGDVSGRELIEKVSEGIMNNLTLNRQLAF